MDDVDQISEEEVVAMLRDVYNKDTSVASTQLLADILRDIDTNWPPETLPFGMDDGMDDEERDFGWAEATVWTDICNHHGLPHPTNFVMAMVLLASTPGSDFTLFCIGNKRRAENINGMLHDGCYEAVKWCVRATCLDAATSKSVPSAKCVLTHHVFAKPALVIPITTKVSFPALARKSLLKFASFFWDKEDVEEYAKLVEDMDLVASPKNKILLDPYMHALWSAGKFGLKPLSPTDNPSTGSSASRNSIRIQFHWLPQTPFKPQDTSKHPTSSPHVVDFIIFNKLFDPDVENLRANLIAHRYDGVPIESGHVFTIEDKDPDNVPLFELFDLRWRLSQVAALSGFSNVTDEEWAEGSETPEENTRPQEQDHDCSDTEAEANEPMTGVDQ